MITQQQMDAADQQRAIRERNRLVEEAADEVVEDYSCFQLSRGSRWHAIRRGSSPMAGYCGVALPEGTTIPISGQPDCQRCQRIIASIGSSLLHVILADDDVEPTPTTTQAQDTQEVLALASTLLETLESIQEAIEQPDAEADLFRLTDEGALHAIDPNVAVEPNAMDTGGYHTSFCGRTMAYTEDDRGNIGTAQGAPTCRSCARSLDNYLAADASFRVGQLTTTRQALEQVAEQRRAAPEDEVYNGEIDPRYARMMTTPDGQSVPVEDFSDQPALKKEIRSGRDYLAVVVASTMEGGRKIHGTKTVREQSSCIYMTAFCGKEGFRENADPEEPINCKACIKAIASAVKPKKRYRKRRNQWDRLAGKDAF